MFLNHICVSRCAALRTRLCRSDTMLVCRVQWKEKSRSQEWCRASRTCLHRRDGNRKTRRRYWPSWQPTSQSCLYFTICSLTILQIQPVKFSCSYSHRVSCLLSYDVHDPFVTITRAALRIKLLPRPLLTCACSILISPHVCCMLHSVSRSLDQQ